MVYSHSFFQRMPGRRDRERKEFSRLMARVEKIRLREGLTKRALAAEIGTSKDALYNWMSGRAIGRKDTVAKLEQFLKRAESAR